MDGPIAPQLHPHLELSLILEKQILEILSAARANRTIALAALRAALVHVETIPAGNTPV